MAGMDKETAQSLLPEVGDILIKKPHLHKSLGIEQPVPRLCTVVFVNRDHLWYRVRFDNDTYECYKVPELPDVVKGGWGKRW